MREAKTLVSKSKEFDRLIQTNVKFAEDYQKLVRAFERRWWTPETCVFFKRLFESLFEQYSVNAKVHVRRGPDGVGMFEVEFLPATSTELDIYSRPSVWNKVWTWLKSRFSKQA